MDYWNRKKKLLVQATDGWREIWMQSIVRKGQGVSGHFIGRLRFDILIKNEYKTKNCICSKKKKNQIS